MRRISTLLTCAGRYRVLGPTLAVLLSILVAPADRAAADPTAEQWLDKLEASADEVDTLKASVLWTTENTLIGDKQYRQGSLLYQAEPTRFAIAFTKRRVGDRIDDIDHKLTFTGRTLIERRGEDKIVHVYELAPTGEEADLGAMTGGPFVLPLNLEKDRVLQRFDVSLAPLGDQAPQGAAVHLRLEPKSGVDEDVQPMDVWFGGPHLLPLRVQTEDLEAGELTEFQLRKPEVNVPVSPQTFEFVEPDQPGWQVEFHPLRQETPATQPVAP